MDLAGGVPRLGPHPPEGSIRYGANLLVGADGAPLAAPSYTLAAPAFPLAAEFRPLIAVGAGGYSNAHSFGGAADAYSLGAGGYSSNTGTTSTRPFGAAGYAPMGMNQQFGTGSDYNARSAHPSADGSTRFAATAAGLLGVASGHHAAPGAAAIDHTVAAGHPAPIGAAPGARPSGSADPFARISESLVEQVWRENSAEVFARVLNKLRQPRRHLYIAVDLEYAAHASTDVRYRPISNTDWYDHLRAFVDKGDVLQIGMALAFEEDDPGRGGGAAARSPPPVIALEINFQFDVVSGNYHADVIKFLREQGHKLDDHQDRGVFPEWVYAGFLRFLPFSNRSVTWITYHGDRDFGFLMRLLQPGRGRGMLPSDRTTFLHEARERFPIFFDVRVLAQVLTEGFAGKLTELADDLGLARIGNAHFAGSDALLTLSCFAEITHRSEYKLAARLSLLSGAEELDMAIRCGRSVYDDSIIMVDVRQNNFEEEANRIAELTMTNFKVIGFKVLLPKLTSSLIAATSPEQEYNMMKRRLSGIKKFQVIISFMNADGIVAYGRLWKFHFSLNPAGMDECLHPCKFAQLLAASGAYHTSEVSWVTHDGSDGVGCLIRSFMMPGDFPQNWCLYIHHLRAVFPVVYHMGFLATRCPDTAQLLHSCNGDPGVLLLLRCYKRLSDHPEFVTICSAIQGKLMVG